MNTPIFMTHSGRLSENWREAFPNADLSSGPADRFDKRVAIQNASLVFLDYLGLNGVQKKSWLEYAFTQGARVIVLSPVPDGDEALAVIKRGAVGYGHTLASPPRLREMAMVVSHGGLWMGKQFLQRIVAGVNQTIPSPQLEEQKVPVASQFKNLLSDRELCVAEQVALGATNQEISARLEIKERTVKSHITSMFQKLNVRNRVELALVLNNIPLTPSNPPPSQQRAL